MNYKVYFIWVFLVVLWNFGVPKALPIFDVLIAIILSFFSKYLEKNIGEKNKKYKRCRGKNKHGTCKRR